MKAHLLFPDRDLDRDASLPAHTDDLVKDLELDTILDAMAGGDAYLRDIAHRVILDSLTDPAEIVYRQQILEDCLRNPQLIRDLYDLAVAAIDGEKKIYRSMFYDRPAQIVAHSVQALDFLTGPLRELRAIADTNAARFSSAGLARFFAMLPQQLDDSFFVELAEHLKKLRFHDGLLLSARLGAGNRGIDYRLRTPARKKGAVSEWLGLTERTSYSFTIPDRDQAGADALDELSNRAMSIVANATGPSTDHILSFFTLLRQELGFYIACLNLHTALTSRGLHLCMPTATAWHGHPLHYDSIYDPALALTSTDPVIGNSHSADGRSLIMITGANSGGKSTLLRSLGLAQLMMQAGTFTASSTFTAATSTGIYTHFAREEDTDIARGRLDDELARMDAIARFIRPGCVLLFNESFASTNEREGSEIARQVVHALTESDVRVLYVTHLYDLAHNLAEERLPGALFLRAERDDEGTRTFHLVEAEPLPTSYGEDVYHQIGGLT